MAKVQKPGDRYIDRRDARGTPIDVSRVRTFVISTSLPASDAGVLIPDGADFSRYDARPVLLWGHDDMGDGIGRGLERRRITSPVDGWEQDFEFAPASVNPDADQKLRFLDWAGFGATSIRFRVTDMNDTPTPEELVMHNLPRWGWIGRKWTLLEVSLVNIQADPGALLKAAKDGVFTEAEAASLVRQVRQFTGGMDIEEIRAAIAAEGDKTRAMLAEMASTITGLRDAVLATNRAQTEAAQAPVAEPVNEGQGGGGMDASLVLVDHYLGVMEQKVNA